VSWYEDDQERGPGQEPIPGLEFIVAPPVDGLRLRRVRPLHPLVPRREMLDIPQPVQRIRCAGCGGSAEIDGGRGHAMVYDQLRLWLRGWRRDPATALDYCPTCAV
jgi:hypothetical protein